MPETRESPTEVELEIGVVRIKGDPPGNLLMDVENDPDEPTLDSGIVRDPGVREAVQPLPIGVGGDGGAAVPVAATNLSTLIGAPITLRRGFVIQAMMANAGPIAVGFSNNVNPTPGAERGAILQPGDSVPIPAATTEIIYVRSTNAADRITWWGG